MPQMSMIEAIRDAMDVTKRWPQASTALSMPGSAGTAAPRAWRLATQGA